MGDFIDSFLGTGGEGGQAAAAANEFSQQAINELRRQFEETQANVDPFIQAGVGQLPSLTQGTTAGGLDERLAEIFGTEGFQNLVGERQRGVQGQLAAGGLTRSGTAIQEAANVPTDLGFMIEQLLTGRSQNLAGSGQNAALGLGGLGAQASQGIGSALIGQGQNISSGILGDQQARAAGVGNLFSLGQLGLKAGNVGGFSDPRIKKNVEKISEIKGLSLVEWDWIDGAKGTIVELFPTIGFMADDVEKLYPQHVSDVCGLMFIDYPSLLDDLEAA